MYLLYLTEPTRLTRRFCRSWERRRFFVSCMAQTAPDGGGQARDSTPALDTLSSCTVSSPSPSPSYRLHSSLYLGSADQKGEEGSSPPGQSCASTWLPKESGCTRDEAMDRHNRRHLHLINKGGLPSLPNPVHTNQTARHCRVPAPAATMNLDTLSRRHKTTSPHVYPTDCDMC